MGARLVRTDPDAIVVEVAIPQAATLAAAEAQIQDALNEAGRLATAAVLARDDTDGRPIEHRGRKYYAKGPAHARC